MIYLPFIFGVLKKFRSFVEITKLRKQRNDRLKDILHNLLAYYQTWLNLENLQMESTIISQSLFCILHRRTWTAFSYSDSKVFPEPNQTNEKNIRTCPFFLFLCNTLAYRLLNFATSKQLKKLNLKH